MNSCQNGNLVNPCMYNTAMAHGMDHGCCHHLTVQCSLVFRSSLGSGSGSGGQGGQGGPHSEQQAILAIEKAYSKPVAFSVRTNVMYDGTLDDDSPVHGCAVRSVPSCHQEPA